MTDAPKFTAAQKAAEAAREVTMRIRVYGHGSRENILGANLTKLLIMEEIARDYAALAEKERLI